MPDLYANENEAFENAYRLEFVARYERWRARSSPWAMSAWRDIEDSRLPSLPFLPRRYHLQEQASLYDPGALEETGEPVADLRQAVEEYGDILLLGESGAGKTTSLWELGHSYATQVDPNRPARLPLMIPLSRYGDNRSILDLIRSELRLENEPGAAPKYPAHIRLAEQLESYLAAFRLVILFDGLDEMPRQPQTDSSQRLAAFREANRPTRFICTSNLPAPRTDRTRIVTLAGLDGESQNTFLVTYFPEQAAQIERALRKREDLEELARNPYMLLMLARVYVEKGEIPLRRGLVVKQFLNIQFARNQDKAGQDCPDAGIITEVLAPLALGIQHEYGRGTSVSQNWANTYKALASHTRARKTKPTVARLLAENCCDFLLESAPDGSVRFSHPLIQDYFAAVGLKNLPESSTIWEEAIGDSQWDPVLELHAGLVADATPLVKWLMPGDPYLAARCVANAQFVQARTLNGLKVRLAKRISSPFQRERIAAAVALGELGGEAAIPIIFGLIGKEDPAGQKVLTRALLRIRSEQLTSYLVRLLNDPSARWRAWAVRALGEIKAARDDALVTDIVRLLRDRAKEVRRAAAEVLRVSNPDLVVPHLMPLLEDDDSSIRWLAVELLGDLQAESAVPQLLLQLKDKDSGTRSVAIRSLCQIMREGIIPYLVPLLSDEDWYVRSMAIQALGQVNATPAIPQLVPLLKDRDEYIRSLATGVLVGLRAEDAIPHVRPLLNDPDDLVRRAAAGVLNQLQTSNDLDDSVPNATAAVINPLQVPAPQKRKEQL